MLLKLHGEKVDNVNKLWKAIGLQSPVPVVVAGMNTFPTACTAPIALGSSCVSANGRPTDPDDTTTFSSGLRNPIEKVDAFGGSFTLNWDFDAFRLTSITAYEHNEFEKAEDVDATAQPTRSTPPFPVAPVAGFEGAFDFFQVSKSNQWSQELRFTSSASDRLRWIAGAFAFGESTAGSTTAIPYFNAMVNSTRLDQDLTVYSGYADLEFAVGDRLSLVAGLRYTDEKVEGVNTTVTRSLNDAATAAAFLPTNGQSPIPTEAVLNVATGMGRNVYLNAPFGESWGEWGGKLGFKYQATEDLLVYGNVSRGFKAGSFTPAPAQSINGSFFNPTDPEFLVAYEVGLKNTFLDGTLRTNLSAYYYDYTDQQLLRVTDVPGFGLVAAQVNAAESSLYGVELESQWAPGAGWRIDLGIGYLNTDVEEFFDIETCSPPGVGTCPPSGQRVLDYSGSELVNAPELTANLGVRKEWAIGSTTTLTIGVDAAYKSSRWFDIPNDPVERDDSYTLLDAQAQLRFGADEQYTVSIWGKNLADEVYFLNKASFPSVGTVEAMIGDPRTYGITFGLTF
jgi:iron complex outermembrane receptor protein